MFVVFRTFVNNYHDDADENQAFDQYKLYYNLENAIKYTVDFTKSLYDKKNVTKSLYDEKNVKIIYEVNPELKYNDNSVLICSREECPYEFNGWIIEEQQPADTEH